MTAHHIDFHTTDDDEDGSTERLVRLPAKWAICDRCNGEGHHANPAFDGTTTEWWLEGDPSGEDLESYFRGGYDVACEDGCDHGKILVPDEDRAHASDLNAYHAHLDDLAAYRAEVAAERRFGVTGERHDAVVIYGRGHNTTTPAYVGACSCGWRGLPCSTRHDANEDVDRHHEDYAQ